MKKVSKLSEYDFGHLNNQKLFLFSVFSCSGMDRLYGNSKELSTRESIVDPVNFIRVSEDSKENQKPKLFIGRNNTEIWAHQGSNVVFDCLVGKPDLEDQGPVSIFVFFVFSGIH